MLKLIVYFENGDKAVYENLEREDAEEKKLKFLKEGCEKSTSTGIVFYPPHSIIKIEIGPQKARKPKVYFRKDPERHEKKA